jgi:UDP-2-acetamido-2,6-beta-L-arabino-hexul-4-ose reductase
VIKNVLVTGARGFVGRNLIAYLRTRGKYEILKHDIDGEDDQLRQMIGRSDFIFHFAGVNRPTNPADFQMGNVETTRAIVETLRLKGRRIPVAFSSSQQAEEDNPYGKSKKAAEDLLMAYSHDCGVKVYLYRFPNIFGKWCRPDYNSAIATFCHKFARGLAVRVDNPGKSLHLIYIDDLAREMLRILEEDPKDLTVFFHAVPIVFEKTLGEIYSMLAGWKKDMDGSHVPDIKDPFSRRLYSTFVSYLDPVKSEVRAETSEDTRGWLFEYVKSDHAGQVFVSSTRPGITRGNHYHNLKIEKFCLVKGRADILLRRIDSTEVVRIPVTDTDIRIVIIPPGYTHSITNTGDADMIVLFWASEVFDIDEPDTFHLEVQP